MYYISETFELPCGFLDDETGTFYDQLVVREMSGDDEDLLSNKKKIQSGKVINDLLVACCTLKSSESGKTLALTSEKAMSMYMGDRGFAMIKIREISEGSGYRFKLECPVCGSVNNFEQDLSKLKPVKMPEPKKKFYTLKLPDRADAAGNVFPGDTIKFQSMDGHSEQKMKVLMEQHPDELFSVNLAARIVEVNDQPIRPLPYLKKLPKKLRTLLRTETQKVEGGVDMALTDATCKCGHMFDQDMPMDVSFFFPESNT